MVKFLGTDTTPPKSILSKELRLFEANCVPSAILHFGSDDKQANYLNEDILTKLSCPKASLRQALIDRYVFVFILANFDLKQKYLLNHTYSRHKRSLFNHLKCYFACHKSQYYF